MKISFGGHDFVLHPAGALLWPARSMVIIADLHLEKGSHYARRGYFLPPYDSRETLQRLLDLCAAADFRRLLVLGDGFHDSRGYDRLGMEEKEMFGRLRGYGLLWIKGNHDRDFVPPGVSVFDSHTEDDIAFRHQAGENEGGEISGHYHPKVEIAYKGGFVSSRCFIEDGRRLILPAFGAYAGGLTINSKPLTALFPGGSRCYAVNGNKVYFSRSQK
jgi:uncharacterized protein